MLLLAGKPEKEDDDLRSRSIRALGRAQAGEMERVSGPGAYRHSLSLPTATETADPIMANAPAGGVWATTRSGLLQTPV